MSRNRKPADWCPEAIIETLDPVALAVVRRLRLPIYEGDLGWTLLEANARTPLKRATIIFIVASGDSVTSTAKRVERYRTIGQAVLGVCMRRSSEPLRGSNGVLNLSPARSERDLRKLLTVLTSVMCESQPKVTVCIDWNDVKDLLDLPGEVFLEWSQESNEEAVRAVLDRIKARAAGRRFRGVLCRVGGGRNPWIKALRTASRGCHDAVVPDGIVLGGDSVVAFRGRPGCCLLAIVGSSDDVSATAQVSATSQLCMIQKPQDADDDDKNRAK